MVYESRVRSTWIDAFKDLRDKVVSIEGWDLKQDSLASEGYFVLNPPNNSGDDVLIDLGNNIEGSNINVYDMCINHGWDWNDAAQSFAGQQWTATDVQVDDNGNMEHDWPVYYWIQADDTGFHIAVHSEKYDANASFGIMGYELFDRSWNNQITSAGTEQASGVLFADGNDSVSNQGYVPYNANDIGGGYGCYHPDWGIEGYFTSPKFWTYTGVENSDTNWTPPFGKTDLVLTDRSNHYVSHMDRVQNDAGEDKYEIFRLNGVRLALKMV